jgi:hypothetical protein
VIGTYLAGTEGGAPVLDAGDGGPDAGPSEPDASPPIAVSFSAPLNATGASYLGDTLAIVGAGATDASAVLPVTLRLRGEAATAASWPPEQGPPLVAPAGASVNVGLLGPFNDVTRAVALGVTGPSYVASDATSGDIGSDDAVFELVFRAEPGQVIADKRGTGSGWSLTTSASPAETLVLGLSDGQQAINVASTGLVQDAWYHCLLWLSHAAGARADCNGDAGVLTGIHALGSFASVSSLAIGGMSSPSTAPLEVASLSLYRAPSGTLGSPDAPDDGGANSAGLWQDTSRRRFVALTGVMPDVARGTALPNPGLRASSAYVDLDGPPGSGRNLFLVGADWPRIACRSDTTGSLCGYLSEPPRPRLVPPDPSGWMASELTVDANHALFADGENHMAALVASANAAPHVFSASAVVGTTQQVLSFYAKAEAGHRIGVDVSGQNRAVFDVSAFTASSALPAHATIEDWGHQGIVRCAYIFDNAIVGPITFGLHLLDDTSPSGEPFVGDGQSAWVDVAGLQVEVSASYPGSLIGASPQAADQLVFVANDGNVPKGGSVALSMQVLLPAGSPMGSRLTDQAIVNLNLQENYANQVDLFVTGAATGASTLELLGLQGGIGLWAVQDSMSVVDGNRHSIRAEWSARAASMWVDEMQSPATQAVQADGGAPPLLDNLDVGFSVNSSGYLGGLVSSIQVGVP